MTSNSVWTRDTGVEISIRLALLIIFKKSFDEYGVPEILYSDFLKLLI